MSYLVQMFSHILGALVLQFDQVKHSGNTQHSDGIVSSQMPVDLIGTDTLQSR